MGNPGSLLNIGCLPAAASRFGLRGTRAEASFLDRLDSENRQPVKNVSTRDAVTRARFKPPFLYADKCREDGASSLKRTSERIMEMSSQTECHCYASNNIHSVSHMRIQHVAAQPLLPPVRRRAELLTVVCRVVRTGLGIWGHDNQRLTPFICPLGCLWLAILPFTTLCGGGGGGGTGPNGRRSGGGSTASSSVSSSYSPLPSSSSSSS